jgi:hypothetical protein
MAIAFAILVVLFVAILVFIAQPVFTAVPWKAAVRAQAERLKANVAFLTEEPHRRSYPRVAELDRAADYIHQQFAAAQARVSEQTYAVDDQTYRYVIASFGPESGERIVVGARYDTMADFLARTITPVAPPFCWNLHNSSAKSSSTRVSIWSRTH